MIALHAVNRQRALGRCSAVAPLDCPSGTAVQAPTLPIIKHGLSDLLLLAFMHPG